MMFLQWSCRMDVVWQSPCLGIRVYPMPDRSTG